MIEPDTKDWTWVLERPCPDCGFDAAGVDRSRLGALIRADARGWAAILSRPGVTERPDERTWSPLEYACHVRDVHRVFAQRLDLMLREDDPEFENWDQDRSALDGRYADQSPVLVAPWLETAAETVASAYDEIADAPDETWSRTGRRSNGSAFTVDTLARYHLHDLVHHAHDVRAVASGATVSAYDGDAVAFSDATWELNEAVRGRLDAFAAAVGPGGRVLEIGSAGGRDALQLERRGLTVRRTDISPGFVALLRERGHDAAVVDPLTDELLEPGEPAYDGVWASACLLHVARPDLPTVLSRLAGATRVGGVLELSVKEGDGERWSTHGHVRAPRRFTYWREGPLREAVESAGWSVRELLRTGGLTEQPWLVVSASRA